MASLINLPALKASSLGGHGHQSAQPTRSHRPQRHRQSQILASVPGCQRPPAFTSRCTPLVSRPRRSIKVVASSAAAAQPSSSDETPKADSGPVAKFKALLSPFSEPSTNKKLLALCGAQALSSVATLIHDTYLPLYLSEELKLSNTKASSVISPLQWTASCIPLHVRTHIRQRRTRRMWLSWCKAYITCTQSSIQQHSCCISPAVCAIHADARLLTQEQNCPSCPLLSANSHHAQADTDNIPDVASYSIVTPKPCCIPPNDTRLLMQIGNLQAMAQFLSNASKSLSGTLADILSPARMIIFGTLLTTVNKPMFALSGYVFASFGTVVCLYWVTFAKVFDRMSKGVREAPGKALIGELAAESGDKTEGAFGKPSTTLL